MLLFIDGAYIVMTFVYSIVDAQLDDVGISFVKNSINAIEARGNFK